MLDTYRETGFSSKNGTGELSGPGEDPANCPRHSNQEHTRSVSILNREYNNQLFVLFNVNTEQRSRPVNNFEVSCVCGRTGEISQFRAVLGLENSVVGAQARTRSNKESKEIMKKNRERAICIVSKYTKKS